MATKRCHYCDKVLRDGIGTRDHIVPKMYGGMNAQWNIVDACRKCNGEKAACMPNCTCERCTTAIFRWRNGERTAVARYTLPEPWKGPVVEGGPQFCMVACKNYGCPYDPCRWPERLLDT